MSDPITPLDSDQLAEQEKKTDHNSYLHKAAVAVDQAANVILDGQPDETISSRMARWDTEGSGIKHTIGKIISKGLDLFEKDHGAIAEAADLERAKNVEKTEENTGTLNGK